MECENCHSEDLKLLKIENKQKYNSYYNDIDEYEVVYFKCKSCGHEFTECV